MEFSRYFQERHKKKTGWGSDTVLYVDHLNLAWKLHVYMNDAYSWR